MAIGLAIAGGGGRDLTAILSLHDLRPSVGPVLNNHNGISCIDGVPATREIDTGRELTFKIHSIVS